MNSESINGDKATMTHTVTLEGGTPNNATVNLRWVEERNAWLVTEFDVE